MVYFDVAAKTFDSFHHRFSSCMELAEMVCFHRFGWPQPNQAIADATHNVNAHVKLHQEIRVWALKSAPP